MSSFSLVDFLHQFFTIAWIGGMIFIGLVLKPSLAVIDPGQAGQLFGAIAKRFTIIAWLSMIVLAITGWMKTPDDALFDTSAGYGLTLTIKHVLYIAAVLIGIAITFVFAPKIRKYTPKPGEAPSPNFISVRTKLEILSSSNMVIGVAIIVLASML